MHDGYINDKNIYNSNTLNKIYIRGAYLNEIIYIHSGFLNNKSSCTMII